ncbi:MAG: hypothetical protein WBW03_02785 [Silvibacterium sp.]|jgi:hypothetical protein
MFEHDEEYDEAVGLDENDLRVTFRGTFSGELAFSSCFCISILHPASSLLRILKHRGA